MRSLVLGGTGLVGRYLVGRLLAADYQVDVVTRGTEGVPAGAGAIIADISNPDWLDRARLSLGDYDVICHLAYATTGNESYDRAVTVGSVQGILRNVGSGDVGHFVYLGSMTVFGQQLPDGVVDESAPRIGDTPYAAQKLEASQAVIEAGWSGMASVLHPTGVYDGNSKRLQTYSEMFRNGYIPTLHGGGGYNNIVHADDVASAIVACIDRKLGRRADEYIVNGEVIPYSDWFLALEQSIGVSAHRRIPPGLSRVARGPLRRAALALKLRPALELPAYKRTAYEQKTIFSAEKASRHFEFMPRHRFRDIFTSEM